MSNLYPAYNTAASEAAKTRHLANAHPANGFYRFLATVAARKERAARNAYLATCPNSHEYLNRKTTNA